MTTSKVGKESILQTQKMGKALLTRGPKVEVKDNQGRVMYTLHDETVKVDSETDQFENKITVRTYTVNGVEFEMVKIIPGSFINRHNETIQMPDKVRWMARTPLTQELYYAVMGTNPAHFKGAQNPIESVSFWDMLRFCNKISTLIGQPEPYEIEEPDAFELLENVEESIKLPEALLWEYAARGGIYNRQKKFAGSDDALKVGWFHENSNGKTQSVAQLQPNELGLYDMSGNVWEATHTIVK